MKLPFIYGVSEQSFCYADENGQLSGHLAPWILSQIFFLIEKFNITFVNLKADSANVCDEYGLCKGIISYLQSGYVDSIQHVSVHQFPVMPMNVSFGPFFGINGCYLIQKPEIKILVRTQDCLDFNQSFDVQILLISFLICLVLIALSIYAAGMKIRQSIRTISWNFFRITINPEGLPLVNFTSVLAIIFAWFAFFMLIIVSCSVQTGLIRYSSFDKIESLQEMVNHGYTPTTLSEGLCRYSIEVALKKIQHEKHDKLHSESGLKFLVEILLNSSRVLIMEQYSIPALRGSVCGTKGSNSMNPIHISQDPVVNVFNLFVVSSMTQPKTRELAFKYVHRAFETSNFDNRISERILFRCVGLDNFYSQCLQSKLTNENVIAVSLNFQYFKKMFIIFFVIIFNAIIVFAIEIVFFHRVLMSY